jgi:hypothetical protein
VNLHPQLFFQIHTNMKIFVFAGCLLLFLLSLVNAQVIVPCNNIDTDCSYQGDGVGVEYVCTNGGMLKYVDILYLNQPFQIQCATRNTNTQHATRNTQHATRNTQHATRNTQHDIQHEYTTHHITTQKNAQWTRNIINCAVALCSMRSTYSNYACIHEFNIVSTFFYCIDLPLVFLIIH